VVRIQFAPQAAGVAVERAGLVRRGGKAPHVTQKFILAEHPRRIRGEDAQQRELFFRELDVAVADLDLAARRVDQELADPDRAVVAAVAAA
jgi:hypothetical protein